MRRLRVPPSLRQPRALTWPSLVSTARRLGRRAPLSRNVDRKRCRVCPGTASRQQGPDRKHASGTALRRPRLACDASFTAPVTIRFPLLLYRRVGYTSSLLGRVGGYLGR